MNAWVPSFAVVAMLGAVVAGQTQSGQSGQPGQPGQSAGRCRIDGRATSGGVPLPGVSILVRAGDVVKAATSTDADGTYAILFAPNASYQISTTFTGFDPVDRDITVLGPPCDQTLNLELSLNARTRPAPAAPAGRAGAAAGPRFQTLAVQADANGAAALEAAPLPDGDDVSKLLPPGFTPESAQSDAVAINGSSDATSLDRGSLNDRFQAIGLGQLDPATGQFGPAGGPQDGALPAAPGGGFGGGGGGRGGPPPGGPGGPGGRGGFALAGRGGRGQNPYQGSATYTFGGSILNAAPYQLRPDVPAAQPTFGQNTFGGTFGGPLKIPGLYHDTARRTNFQLNFTGNESNNLFDQYATVPTDAMRSGDFSTTPTQLVDPKTGQPFIGNQIPTSSFDPTAAALLQFIPSPNLPGPTQNFHVSTLAHSSSQAVSLRVTQNLSPTPPAQGAQGGRGRGGAGGGFGGGGRGGGAGPGGPGGPGGQGQGRGITAVLSGQLQFRRTDTNGLNVFPGLGGDTTNTTFSAPLSLNVTRGRSTHNLTVGLTHSTVRTTNSFTNSVNAAGLAGIEYPATDTASTDPINWGVPNLSFSGFTGVRGASASLRTDDRLNLGYTWMHPTARHRFRVGGDFRYDASDSQINGNPRGTFTFTGLYSSGSPGGSPAPGADFADFLLGSPQQATLQVGGTSRLRQRSFDGYVEDNWQKTPKLTLNLGLRYELALPYVEANGRMANLDAAPGFTSVTQVQPGQVGPDTGAFPNGLLNTDANNLGPRLGFAYRLQPRTILRGGYSITYNSGSYASIARELAGQPPFADTDTFTSDPGNPPMTIAEALTTPVPTTTTTNNWGVDRDYELGMIQTWNATVTRNLTQDWMLQVGYTGTKGTNLDVLRAPDLGPGDIPIPGTQAFIWESSGGHSIMNAGNVQITRRLANGFSGGLSYTIARARDNASSLGAGGPVVAQNDQNLNAEWARSSFDRRHQISGNLYFELPWGPNRRWLKNGGLLAGIVGEWSARFTFTLQSGIPLTARVLGAASDLLRGVNGSLRANYNGEPISLADPTVDEFFDVTAFSAPAQGQFGDSSRNLITGPGTRQLNGLLQRDVRLGGTRAVTLQINAVNLLNTVQWAAVDTNINSPTFGHVLSARPMRAVTLTARFRF